MNQTLLILSKIGFIALLFVAGMVAKWAGFYPTRPSRTWGTW